MGHIHVTQPPKVVADAVLSKVNPVSTTWYVVLDTTINVRIIGIEADITWATTQPTPLEVRVIIDGQTVIFSKINPVSAVGYYARWRLSQGEAWQNLDSGGEYQNTGFLLEGRSVKVQVRVNWSITQPTPLVCRVKYAKY